MADTIFKRGDFLRQWVENHLFRVKGQDNWFEMHQGRVVSLVNSEDDRFSYSPNDIELTFSFNEEQMYRIISRNLERIEWKLKD